MLFKIQFVDTCMEITSAGQLLFPILLVKVCHNFLTLAYVRESWLLFHSLFILSMSTSCLIMSFLIDSFSKGRGTSKITLLMDNTITMITKHLLSSYGFQSFIIVYCKLKIFLAYQNKAYKFLYKASMFTYHSYILHLCIFHGNANGNKSWFESFSGLSNAWSTIENI